MQCYFLCYFLCYFFGYFSLVNNNFNSFLCKQSSIINRTSNSDPLLVACLPFF